MISRTPPILSVKQPRNTTYRIVSVMACYWCAAVTIDVHRKQYGVISTHNLYLCWRETDSVGCIITSCAEMSSTLFYIGIVLHCRASK